MSKMPRTFCVTLKETPLRTRGFMESAKQAGVNAELFYGLFGTKMGLVPAYPNILETPSKDVFMTVGNVGCMLSHIVLWTVLSYLPEEEFFIVEDDAIFSEDFQLKFDKTYALLPDNWEMAYVGWVPYGKDQHPLVVHEGITIRLPSATHAYLVKKSAIRKMLDSVMPIQSPIDLTIIDRILPQLNYYVFDPPLVMQRSYLNTTDPTWSSLVYDWENDLYGCKKTISKGLAMEDGWHDAERNDQESWRWSKDQFSFRIPDRVDSITIECSTPIDNVITFSVGPNVLESELTAGSNQITVPMSGQKTLTGKMATPFVPAEQNPSSSGDRRVLGICFNRIILNVGTTAIPVGVDQLCKFPMPPNMFKL